MGPLVWDLCDRLTDEFVRGRCVRREDGCHIDRAYSKKAVQLSMIEFF